MKNIFAWLCSNKLSSNVDKSKLVIFHAGQKIVKQSISLKFNALVLKQANCTKGELYSKNKLGLTRRLYLICIVPEVPWPKSLK